MGLGYRITKLADEPIVLVKMALPPRLDVERMFGEIAEQITGYLPEGNGRVYRINDMSVFNAVNVFSQVVRGLAYETRSLPGTNSDPRLIPVFVGKGKTTELIVEALKQRQYGGWQVPHFPSQEEALTQTRQWIRDGVEAALR